MEEAATILTLDDMEDTLTDKKAWRNAKQAYENEKIKFDKLRDEYIDLLLKTEDRGAITGTMTNVILETKQKADASWHPSLEYLMDNFIPKLDREAKKNPKIRRAIKLAPLVTGIVVVLAYFIVRFTSAVTVTADVESREGIIQRAQIVEKALRYDDWADTKVRRGGWLKGIMLWPIEPTEEELNAGGELTNIIVELAQLLETQARICNGPLQGSSTSFSSEQIDMINSVTAYLTGPNVQWEEPALLTVAKPIQQAYPCG